MHMDAHTEYAQDYVRQCLAVLQQTGADNVGGPWVAKGEGLVGRAIAAAFQSLYVGGEERAGTMPAIRQCSTPCISVVGGARFLSRSAYSMRNWSATRMMKSASGLPGPAGRSGNLPASRAGPSHGHHSMLSFGNTCSMGIGRSESSKNISSQHL
jgi:hypothetical protein